MAKGLRHLQRRPAAFLQLAMEQQLQQLRLQCLSEEERQWWWPDVVAAAGAGPLTPQNEAAALSRLLLDDSADRQPGGLAAEDRKAALQQLCETFVSRTQARLQALGLAAEHSAPGGEDAAQGTAPEVLDGEGSAEAALMKGAAGAGILTTLAPATCAGGVRGMVATRPVAAGRPLISLPLSQLISYDTALQSSLGAVLRRIPGLDEESAAVLWTMVDRRDAESPHAAFWASLPQAAFGTALGVPGRVLRAALAGCPWLLEEALEARKHVRAQFRALQGVISALVKAYPQHVTPDAVSWRSYLWAVQLWYAYSIQVQLPDGQLRPCLAPVLCLLNHSAAAPHSVAFSRLDARTQRLNVRTFRTLPPGEQAMLSYGPLPNSHLLLFYGFCDPSNPYDVSMVSLPDVAEPSAPAAAGEAVTDGREGPGEEAGALRRRLWQASGLQRRHAVRGWGPLPRPLLAAARLVVATPEEMQELSRACGLDRLAAGTGEGGGSGKSGGKGGKGGKGGAKAASAPDTRHEAAAAAVRAQLVVRLEAAASQGAWHARALRLVAQCADSELQALADGAGRQVEEASADPGGRAGEGAEGDSEEDRVLAEEGEGEAGGAAFLQAACVLRAGVRRVLLHVRAEVERSLGPS